MDHLLRTFDIHDIRRKKALPVTEIEMILYSCGLFILPEDMHSLIHSVFPADDKSSERGPVVTRDAFEKFIKDNDIVGLISKGPNIPDRERNNDNSMSSNEKDVLIALQKIDSKEHGWLSRCELEHILKKVFEQDSNIVLDSLPYFEGEDNGAKVKLTDLAKHLMKSPQKIKLPTSELVNIIRSSAA
eukprot:Tbor_TRINITY_DN4961_c0_g3::TRINITY_DN4961_c0_g3_i1::g.9850::m.9850